MNNLGASGSDVLTYRFGAPERRFLLGLSLDKEDARRLAPRDILRLEQDALPRAANYLRAVSRTDDVRGSWIPRFRRAAGAKPPKDTGDEILRVLQAAMAPRAVEAGRHAVVLIGNALDVRRRDLAARVQEPLTSADEFAQVIRVAVADLPMLRSAIEDAACNAPQRRLKPSKVDAVGPIWEVLAELNVPLVSTPGSAFAEIVARCFEALGLPEVETPRAVRDFVEREKRERRV